MDAEFAQAEAIDGVNLTTSYKINVYAVRSDGSQLLLLTSSSSTPQFKVKFRTTSGVYILIKIVTSDGIKFATALPPIFSDVVAQTVVDSVSSITAKVIEIVASQAKSGDAAAVAALAKTSIQISEAAQLASSISMAVKQQQQAGVSSQAIDLTSITKSLAAEANSKVASLEAQGKTASEIVKAVSTAEYNSVFSDKGASVSMGVLAYRVKPDLGSVSSSIEVSNSVLKSAASTSPVIAAIYGAYQILATTFRTAESVDDAVEAQSTVDSQYDTIYQSCVSVTTYSSSCYASNYTPPPPPADFSTGGSSTGGTSTGGTSTGGGSTGGGGSTLPPTSPAVSVSFTDTDTTVSEVGGSVSITKANDESNVTHYNLYWGSNSSSKLAGQSVISSIAKTGSNLQYSIVADTAIPVGATHLLVFTKNDGGEMASGVSVLITDNKPSGSVPSIAATSVSFTDTGTVSGQISGTVMITKASNETTITHYKLSLYLSSDV